MGPAFHYPNGKFGPIYVDLVYTFHLLDWYDHMYEENEEKGHCSK